MHLQMLARRSRRSGRPLLQRQGCLDVTIAPRGAAKSTLIALIFPVHALLYRTEAYIVMLSATLRQAQLRLGAVRDTLTNNPRLQPVFTRELADLQRASARTLCLGPVRMDAFSAGTELRGISHEHRRPSWIILDDIERSDRVRSARYRRRLAEWFSEVVEHLGDTHTDIDVIGTLLHPNALLAELHRRPDARSRLFRSILREADRHDLWDAWRRRYHDLENPHRAQQARAFFDRHRTQMLRGAKVLWPHKEDYYALQLMRETHGRAAFDKEKQNQPWSDSARVFVLDHYRRFEPAGDALLCEPRIWARPGEQSEPSELAPPRVCLDALRRFGFLDPALGGHSRGDFAAIATVGVDPNGYLYLLDVWLERTTPSRQIDRAFELHARWRYQAFGIETNAFQRLLLEPLEAERRRRQARGRPWDLPVVERRHRGDKASRILALEPLLRNGWLLLNRHLDDALTEQLEQFPAATHDDGPDAVAAVVDLARKLSDTRLATSIRPRAARRSVTGY